MLGKSDGEPAAGQGAALPGVGAKLAPEALARRRSPTTASTSGCRRRISRTPTTGSRSTTTARSRSRSCETNTEPLKRLRKKFESMLDRPRHARGHCTERKLYLHEAMDISATAHQAGTVRFGTDPTASVLDVDCKAHELDNLYVVDSSFFASIGAVNPTLTIIANALRVGEHLLERLG